MPPRRPQKVLNDTKLIINSQGGPLGPIEDQFKTSRGPLFHKQVTGSSSNWFEFLFLEAQYFEVALMYVSHLEL